MRDDEFFYRLTPEPAMQALEKLGFETSGHVLALNSLENRVFDLRLENGEHIVAKFYRPARWSAEQIQEEHDFLFELAAAELPVIAPLQRDGTSLFELDGIHFSLWPRIGGREPDELDTADIESLGRLFGRLHWIGRLANFHHRETLHADRMTELPLHFLLEQELLPAQFIPRYEHVAKFIASEYARLSEELPYIRVHGDAHKGNLLRKADGFLLLDFDDAVNGPAIQDMWMFFPGSSKQSLMERDIFAEAYSAFCDLPAGTFALAEILRAMRIMYFSGWIARRRSDPAFKTAFPLFGTEEYWQEELAALEDICAAEGRGPVIYSDDSREELTNKDFFWDL